MSEVVSFRVSRELKRKMRELKHINWSEVVRKAIAEVIAREEAYRRGKDFERMRKALAETDALSRRVEGWSGVEEIRRWREKRS